jgi:hypothetical protein
VGIGTSRLNENTQLIEKYETRETPKTAKWANIDTRLTRGNGGVNLVKQFPKVEKYRQPIIA